MLESLGRRTNFSADGLLLVPQVHLYSAILIWDVSICCGAAIAGVHVKGSREGQSLGISETLERVVLGSR